MYQNEQNLKRILGDPISRQEAFQILKENPEVYSQYLNFPLEHQKLILSFIQGNRGLPILYDPFFKKFFNPSDSPERLERFLSSLMNQKIRIIDVEMQKHGYKFTGERSTCYMSDLVMRQYNKVKSERGKNFTFKDMKPVYLIVLMEDSSENFKTVAPEYIHHAHYVCDTNAEINFLANYTYVSLDTFHSVRQNISSYLDAWFTFLSSDDPQDIINLITTYPEFEEYYHDITIFRTKPKELINMYSEVLAQIDKNTERYMVDEMKQEVEELRQEKDELQQEKESLQQENDELQQELLDNARNLFLNKVSFEIVRDSIKALSEETLKEIYDDVMASKNE